MKLHVRVVHHGFFRVLVRKFLGCRDNGAINDALVKCESKQLGDNTAILCVLENLLIGAPCRDA